MSGIFRSDLELYQKTLGIEGVAPRTDLELFQRLVRAINIALEESKPKE